MVRWSISDSVNAKWLLIQCDAMQWEVMTRRDRTRQVERRYGGVVVLVSIVETRRRKNAIMLCECVTSAYGAYW